MTVEIAHDLVEIHDPDIDPAGIMKVIHQRIEQRRKEKNYEQRSFPSFGVAACPEEPEDIPFDADLHHYLRLANETFAQVETRQVLASSPATRLPVLGRLWGTIRAEVHNLVLFYVNRSVTHQVTMNRYLVSVLNRMTLQNEEQQREIERLKSELASLRQEQEAEK